jgi:hypothetical protein
MNTNDSKRLAVVTFFMICLCIIYTSVSQAETISDDFSGPTLNTQLWQAFSHDQQQWFVQQGGELIIQPTGDFNSGVNGNCWLKGDFDMMVDYKLINWSNDGFLSLGFESDDGAYAGMLIRRSNAWNNSYYAAFGDDYDGNTNMLYTSTSDQNGKLRLTREGSIMTAYFWGESGWVEINFHDYGTDIGDSLQMCLSAAGEDFNGQNLGIAFDNFKVTAEEIQCVPLPGTLLLLGSGLLGLAGLGRRLRKS